MKRNKFLVAILIVMLLIVSVAVVSAECQDSSTMVKGHCQNDRYDQDDNGYPDAGVNVNGHYAMNQYGCDYVVTYRGDFGNDGYLNSGWIMNNINCNDGTTYQYLIVSSSDPRYTGNPEWSIWANWEYHTLVIAGSGAQGNLVRPENAGS